MESLPFNNYGMEEVKQIYTKASESQPTTAIESFPPSANNAMSSSPDSLFSPTATPFQSRVGSDFLTLMSQQEPRQADPAPSTTDIDDVLMNLRLNGSDLLFDDVDQTNAPNHYMPGNRAETVVPTQHNIWSEGAAPAGARNGEMLDTFDFLVKSISSANNYVSMLTREQLHVLRSIRPSLLYEFLQEVAKVRSDKRLRRALPNECAFCKNNGENEECYTSHALKDWRGRVLCPVLRAFRCPRCGATGDRAHTIKYCQDSGDAGLDRTSNLAARRRLAAPAGRAAAAPPAPAPHASLWSNFGIN